MRKSFKYRLSPTRKQAEKLQWVLDRCRELYNAGLSERRDAYRMAGKSISCYDQINDLPEIKEIREEYQEIGSHVLQDVLRRLDKAMQNFFRRVKQGQEPGYPRFQGRDRYDSFTFPDQAGWKLDGAKLAISKLGSIKVKLHRAIEGKVKTATVKREGCQWYIVFSCEVGKQVLPLSYEDVGIDLGVSYLATLSTGETIAHPRHWRKAEDKITALQQSLARKKRGSHRRQKAKKALSAAYRKVRHQRADYLHKASRGLINRFQVIVFEDIQTVNLTKRPKPKQDENGTYLPNNASVKAGLNTSILDAGWAMFVAMCRSKAEEAGRTLLQVNPHSTSQICSSCGTVRKKELSERWHSCDCGTELDRDHNAAINILARGKHELGGKHPTASNGCRSPWL